MGKADKNYLDFETTDEIEVPDKIIDQVVGQDRGVEVIKKAARQRRNVFLIGKPGTGKSMLGRALSELLPKKDLADILVFPSKDENRPKIKEVPAGKGKEVVSQNKLSLKGGGGRKSMFIFFGIFLGLTLISYLVDWIASTEKSPILQAADRISGTIFMVSMFLVFMIFYASYKLGKQRGITEKDVGPKLLVDNSDQEKAPFVEATGIHAGALLGDVKHDPFQSGGLGTPAHQRVEAGQIHEANKGVLFIDEVAALKPETQVNLLTAMEEGEFSITGRSERSSGAMVKTEPVPCDFVFVAAGNVKTLEELHPALRDRMKGYGYEVYVKDKMEDTKGNRKKLARFVAQEVKKDGNIPHFTKEAVKLIIEEARRKANRKDYLTLELRDLGGVIRAAGDLAKERDHEYVKKEDVLDSKELSFSLEKQIAGRFTKEKKEYQIIRNEGHELGRVNGLGVIKKSDSGIVLPVESAIAPAMKKEEGEIIATGKLGEIAQEAVQNVSAIIKKQIGENISDYDIHIQFVQAYPGVEGTSASISVATALFSALNEIPVKQNLAMTGSLSVKGEVLPVGGITAKVKAAIEAGIDTVLVPKENKGDAILTEEEKEKVEIVPIERIEGVIEESFEENKAKKELIEGLKG